MDEIQDVRMNYLLHYAIHKHDMEIWEGKDVGLQRKVGFRYHFTYSISIHCASKVGYVSLMSYSLGRGDRI